MEKINVRRHIFEFLLDHHERLNYQPCRSEICKIFSGLSDDVDLHVEQLAREGLITFDADEEQIFLTPPYTASKLIRLQKGSGTGESEVIALDLQAVGVNMASDLLAQVVGDDSMIDAGIRKDDIAIYRAGEPAQGEIVMAEISGELVFRRFIIIKDIPHLLAENLNQPDLLAAFGMHIHGVLCCVISPKFKSATNSVPQEARKVNYTHGATSAHNRTRWPAAPFGIGLNDRVGPNYTVSRCNRTSEDPPDQPYPHSRYQTSKDPIDGGREKGARTGLTKANSKSVGARDLRTPMKKAVPDGPRSKRVPQTRERLRV